ncbi:hypothetical protein BDV19DRAFT_358243 [Aspergillus venezuelensis]
MVNNAELVRKILQQRHGLQASFAAADPTGYNAFHIACQYSSFDIVEMLLVHGTDPNATRGDGWTPLHIACHRYNASIVGVLLDHGASVNPTTSNRILPLHLAIDVGAVEVVKLLLQQDDIQTRDTFGDHLFFYAAERGESEIKNLLLPSYRSASVSDEMLTCDMFTTTVFDFDNEGEIMDVKSTTISTLLGWFTPQPPPQVPYAQPNMLRWIHIPANNPTWIEVLLMRWAISDGGDVGDIKRLCSLGLSHAHRGQYPHSRFYRPSCQMIGKHIWACIPYLHFETVDGYISMQNAISKSKRARMPPDNSQSQSRDELLARSYPVSSVGGLHIRRTLDQFAYPNLDTQSRDLDQVVLRHQLRAAHAEPKLYMVDQLWMLVLGENLVVTSFPQGWEQPENDRFNTLTAVLDTLRQPRPVHSVHDLTAIITDRCCGAFDRFAPHDEHYQFLSMFDASVGFAAENEARRFEKLRRASIQASAWLKANGGSARSLSTRHKQDPSNSGSRDNPAFVDEFLDLGPETDLMFKIKDIRDEIGMVLSVLDHQRVVLPELGSQLRKLDALQSSKIRVPGEIAEQVNMVEMYLKDLERMDRQASHLHESVLGLLDLKQKHANPFEARLARNQAAGAARQGKTIMIFTIVTIVFLPLSFITSFFTIEITEFPQTAGTSTLPLSFVAKYVFGVGLGIAIPLVLIAFAAQDFKLGFRALYDFFQRGGAAEKASGNDDKRGSVPGETFGSSRDYITSIKRARTRPLSPEERC